MAGFLDSPRVREWKRRMARFGEARQSVAEFCRKEGISAPSFYQWRKRLCQRASPADRTAEFTPVRLVAATSVAVHLPGGTQLHVPTSDPQALRLVVATLARIDARRAGGGPC